MTPERSESVTGEQQEGNSRLVRDPSGQPVLLVMEPQGGSLSQRMCQALGRLQWLLPDKSMVEAERIRLPNWPLDVAAWRIKQRPIAPLTFPGHDAGPVAVWNVSTGWLAWGPTPWAALS